MSLIMIRTTMAHASTEKKSNNNFYVNYSNYQSVLQNFTSLPEICELINSLCLWI